MQSDLHYICLFPPPSLPPPPPTHPPLPGRCAGVRQRNVDEHCNFGKVNGRGRWGGGEAHLVVVVEVRQGALVGREEVDEARLQPALAQQGHQVVQGLRRQVVLWQDKRGRLWEPVGALPGL